MTEPSVIGAPEGVKRLARGVGRLLVLPLLLSYLVEGLLIGRQRAFPGFSHLLSLVPGLPGEYLRREFYRSTLTQCSASASISFGTIFATPDVSIADRVYIGAFCVIGQCVIERNVLIASRVSILAGLHQHGIADLTRPIRDQPGTLETVRIEEDCFIGEGAIVAANVGKHSVVSTGSVVFSAVPPFSIVRGNPAAVVRKRE